MAGKKQTLWTTNLQGIVQRQDQDKIPVNSSPLLVNISLDNPGTWKKRPGTLLYGSSIDTSERVRGGLSFNTSSADYRTYMIRGNDLCFAVYGFTGYGGTFPAVVINAFNTGASEDIESVFYKTSEERMYFTSGNFDLAYSTGIALTTVGAGGDEIKGETLATTQNTLFIGNVSFGGNDYPDRVYYSLFDSANNRPSDQFWNDDEGDLASSTRWFTVLKPITAMIPFGVGSNEILYVFTREAMYAFDMRYEQNDVGIRKVFDIGCAGPRSVTICNNWLIWMDPHGSIWQWYGAGNCNKMSWAVEDDDIQGNAIISQIPGINLQFGSAVAGSFGSTFYFNLGDITYKGVEIDNAVLKGLLSQDGSVVLWTVYSYSFSPSIMLNNYNTSRYKQTMLWGDDNSDAIYLMNYGTTDNGEAITARAITRFENLGSPFMTKSLSKMFVKYAPSSVEDSFLKISYATNGYWNYTTLSDPDGSPEVTKHGTIDMYDENATLKYSDIKWLELPADMDGKDISLEFYNDQVSETFEIQGYGYVVEIDNKLDQRVE